MIAEPFHNIWIRFLFNQFGNAESVNQIAHRSTGRGKDLSRFRSISTPERGDV